MEALAIVSLAGNILQFLDFVGGVVSKTREVKNSVSGTLKEHGDQESLTRDLKSLSGRLKHSAAHSDPALEKLCSRCCDVSDELITALEDLAIKGKCTRSQSVRKALKILWGKPKLQDLDRRLGGFRQELNLHITVELRARVDLLDVRQTASFQNLDDVTKHGAIQILEALQTARDHLVAVAEEQKRDLRVVQTHIGSTLTDIESAAINLEEHNEQIRIFTASEQQKSCDAVLSAITEVGNRHEHVLASNTEDVSTRIGEDIGNTRAQIIETLNVNQEVLKQEISELQRGKHHVEQDIYKKLEELKDLVIMINASRDGPKRESLKKRGNSITVIVLSLPELYKSLEVFD